MHWEPRGILRFLPTSTQNAHPREGPKVSTDMRRKDDPGNTKNARMVLNSLRKILYVYARKSQFTFNDSCCQRTIRAHGGNMKKTMGVHQKRHLHERKWHRTKPSPKCSPKTGAARFARPLRGAEVLAAVRGPSPGERGREKLAEDDKTNIVEIH